MTVLNIGQQAAQQMPATSGTYNFSVTRDDIIRSMMLKLGVLEESEVPTAQETFDCARELNLIVKQLVAQIDKAPGFKMWQRERGDLFMTTSQYAYELGAAGDNWAGGCSGIRKPVTYNATTLAGSAAAGATVLTLASINAVNIGDYFGVLIGTDYYWDRIAAKNVGAQQITLATASGLPAPALGSTYCFNYSVKAQRPFEIKTVLLRQVDGEDTPLDRMTLEQYEALPTKTQPGYQQDPTMFYYEPRVANLSGRIYFDGSGASDVTKTVHVVYLRQNQDMNNPGDAPEFPQEWFNALTWMLMLQCHSMFDVDWTPGMEKGYSTALMPARESSPEVSSMYFQPDGDDY